jgi:pimeloyl-ACP methyl ester carboxylesterase
MRGREAERPARRMASPTQGAARRRPARPYSSSTEKPMNPDTIVLIHGFWVTPRSWENWKAHYEQQGYRVLMR